MFYRLYILLHTQEMLEAYAVVMEYKVEFEIYIQKHMCLYRPLKQD